MIIKNKNIHASIDAIVFNSFVQKITSVSGWVIIYKERIVACNKAKLNPIFGINVIKDETYSNKIPKIGKRIEIMVTGKNIFLKKFLEFSKTRCRLGIKKKTV